MVGRQFPTDLDRTLATVVHGSVYLGLPVDAFPSACIEVEYFPLVHVDVFNGLLNVSLVFLFFKD